MLSRRLFSLFLLPVLALFCPACAFAPDRWTAVVKDSRDAHTGRWSRNELDFSLSGPIPPFFHD